MFPISTYQSVLNIHIACHIRHRISIQDEECVLSTLHRAFLSNAFQTLLSNSNTHKIIYDTFVL